jgi:dihydropteroate synthase
VPARSWPPLRTRRGALDLTRPNLIAVLNVTPDSFSDGGIYADPVAAVERGLELERLGADLLDVGGESTRPGAAPVSADDEFRRVRPVITALVGRLSIPISIDTRRSAVAEAALLAGASVVNDVSGLADPDLARVVARHEAPVIVGHLRGDPSRMQQDIRFENVVAEVIDELGASVEHAVSAGVPRDQIVVDAGLGFGKTAEQTVALLAATGLIRERLGRPICVGPSRKSFIGALTGAPVGQRIMGTAAAVAVAVHLGADLVRVHDVAEMKDVVTVASAVRRGGAGDLAG